MEVNSPTMKEAKNIQEITLWINEYASKSNSKTLIIGISGGIDSAVVSTLCCMTGIDTYLVSMPIKQNPDHLIRAKSHMSELENRFSNAHVMEIDLTPHFELFNSSSKYDFFTDLALANTRSRLRMTMLYQVAGSLNGLVVGTGNKVEDFGVGFFTKYGDGGVDISPIGDFTKTEVRSLAKHLGIIQSIQEAKPSDGLWDYDGKDDEDQLGATYEELEWAMNYIEINPFYTPTDLDAMSDRELVVLRIYKYMHDKNLHKMQPIPVYRK